MGSSTIKEIQIHTEASYKIHRLTFKRMNIQNSKKCAIQEGNVIIATFAHDHDHRYYY